MKATQQLPAIYTRNAYNSASEQCAWENNKKENPVVLVLGIVSFPGIVHRSLR